MLNPVFLYDNADVLTKRKLMSIFIKENLVFDEVCFVNNFNYASQSVYGISTDSNHFLEKESDLSIFMELTDEEILIYHDIVNIEKKTGNTISKELLMKILRFLIEYAQICINK